MRRHAEVGDEARAAFQAYAADVRAGRFPAEEHWSPLASEVEAGLRRERFGSG